MPAVPRSRYLDLSHAPVDKQLDAGNIAAVIRRKEQHGLGYLIGASHSAHRHAGHKAGLYHLDLFLVPYRSAEDWRVYWTGTDGVDADVALLQISCPGPGERPHRGLGCAVNG